MKKVSEWVGVCALAALSVAVNRSEDKYRERDGEREREREREGERKGVDGYWSRYVTQRISSRIHVCTSLPLDWRTPSGFEPANTVSLTLHVRQVYLATWNHTYTPRPWNTFRF